MAGHSKWAQIKRTKAVVDAKRGAVFTRLGREIMVAARAGADPAGNFQLRTAIEKAKAAGMPNANIERAIAKGSGQGQGEGEQFEEVRYEGYGPGGVAVLVEAFTDNRNRTAADLRLAFSKNGGKLGETGCVGYLFENRSVVSLSNQANICSNEEQLLEFLLELEEQGGPTVLNYTFVDKPGDSWQTEIQADFKDLEALQVGLTNLGLPVSNWEHRWIPLSSCELIELEPLKQCLKLLDALETLDDVRSVSSNLEFSQKLFNELEQHI